MGKKIVAKLVLATVLATGVLVGTPSPASADLCFDIWTMSKRPWRVCVWHESG